MSKGKFNHKKVKQMFLEKGIIRCEMCNADDFLSFAHRKKRRHYVDDMINDFDEILLLCVPCHQIIEKDPISTAIKFKELRG